MNRDAEVRELDVLFVCEHALWPADRGFCVHGFQMARAMHELGHRVGVATIEMTPGDAPPLMHELAAPWPAESAQDLDALHHAWRGPYSWLRHRIADYQGRNLPKFSGVVELVRRHRPKAVVALGQHGPMMLAAIEPGETQRIWYAADEPVYFQLSCMMREPVRKWRERFSMLALYGGMHVAYARGMDGVIGVSPADKRLLKWMTGVKRAITLRNGVDLNYFSPDAAAVRPNSVVFWGSMDFEPNIDAVRWFAGNVWPLLRQEHPTATWQIVGRDPHQTVRDLHGKDGIVVTGGVPDVRTYARSAAAVVLPLQCGGGIKNKLLEAAAMGLPIVASPRAVRGLIIDRSADGSPPLAVCREPRAWKSTVEAIWSHAELGAQLGESARYWAHKRHSWNTAAEEFASWLAIAQKQSGHGVDMHRRAA